MSSKLKKHNCKNCDYNLSKKLLKDISFNWKNIKCPNCETEYDIDFSSNFYNSFSWAIPLGAIATLPIYLNIEPVFKFIIIFTNLILILFIFIYILVKKSNIE